MKELQGLKSELDQTKQLSENLVKLCDQLAKEKNELENNLKKSNYVIKELQDKMTEYRSLWDASKTKLEATIVEVQTKLDTVEKERNVLSQKHEDLYTSYRNDKNEWKKCNDGAMKLKTKMAEDQGLWDSCRVNLKGKLAELQNAILEERKYSQKQQELSTKLRQEKIQMENKLKKINDTSKKLNTKMSEDKRSWDSCKEKLENQVSELQNELNEAKVFSQGHEQLCKLRSELLKENNQLESKVREYSDGTEELKAKLSETGCLWESSKTELEATVTGLQNELNETKVLSLKDEEACIQLRHEKIKLEGELREMNNRNEELHEKMTEKGYIWDTCKVNLEGMIVKLQKKLNETKILAHHNQVLCNEISREKAELENNLNRSINETQQLKEKLAEDRHMWDASKGEFEVTIAKLQNDLNEARILSQKLADAQYEKKTLIQEYRALWAHLRDEKYELEDKLRECNDRNKELHAQMREYCRLWEARKAKFEDSIAGLQNNFNQSINETKQLKEKLATCTGEFQVTIAKLQNELNEATMLSHKHEDWCSQSEYKKYELEKAFIRLQNELDKTNILREKDQEVCNVLREENNQLENKLKECNDRIGDLNRKIEENEWLWVSSKADLENKVADLQSEKWILSKEYKLLLAHLTDEKDELENKLRECNDRNKELHAQMREDTRLWESCKANFEGSVAGLQNNLDLMTNEGRILSQEYVELCIECEFLKAHLGDYNDILSSMEDETCSLMSLSEGNAKTVEALQTRVQLITHEQKKLSKTTEELTTENESLKLKLEELITENERNSLRSTPASREVPLIQENGLLRQVHELQNRLPLMKDYRRVSTDDILDLATWERQLLTSLSENSDKIKEDLVIENRTVKQEALELDQENQLLQKDISIKQSLLHTKDGKIAELNAKMSDLKNAIQVLEEIGRKNTKVLEEYGGVREEQEKKKESEEKREEFRGRVSHRNQTAFIGNLISCILLDIEKSNVGRRSSTATKSISLPSHTLLCGCPYGWFGGIG
ncbi:uncharacterized protein LOC131054934 [Cryptomeria japonica]|uniref:uncharacterized protein LOC131054934 n=1 Tax=Cryptomeria japonica TaxID=3369 RepID=UPI0027D9EC23|nr:uncharacterized protein LOC131054934 [Cryptomeria japonica]